MGRLYNGHGLASVILQLHYLGGKDALGSSGHMYGNFCLEPSIFRYSKEQVKMRYDVLGKKTLQYVHFVTALFLWAGEKCDPYREKLQESKCASSKTYLNFISLTIV